MATSVHFCALCSVENIRPKYIHRNDRVASTNFSGSDCIWFDRLPIEWEFLSSLNSCGDSSNVQVLMVCTKPHTWPIGVNGDTFYAFGMFDLRKSGEHWFHRKTSFSTKSLFSLAALTHERYLIVCIVTPLWLVLTNWNYKKSTYFILWGTTVIYIAVELLSQNNPLRGGGEEQFSGTYGLWILDHFVLALKKLLVGTDGNSIYPNHQIFGPLRIAVVLILCVVVYFCVRKVIGLNNAEFADSKIANRDRNKFYSFIYFQLLISGCLILMASTVKSRIEGRWLFGSEILLLIVVCSIIGVLREKRLTVLYLCLIVFAYVANNICNLNNIDKFEVNRAEVNNILLQVSSMDKPLAAYNVSLTGFNSWVFAYGSVFNQIEHPPNNISFDGNCDTPCLQIKEDNGNTIVTWQS